MVAQVAQTTRKVRKPLGILGLRRATTHCFLVARRWHAVAQKQKGGSRMALYKDYWPKGTFPKQKHRAYKQLETDGLLKVEHVIYYKNTGAVELWFTTDKELDDIHKLLKENAAKEERA